jgi:hypothetical protein
MLIESLWTSTFYGQQRVVEVTSRHPHDVSHTTVPAAHFEPSERSRPTYQFCPFDVAMQAHAPTCH